MTIDGVRTRLAPVCIVLALIAALLVAVQPAAATRARDETGPQVTMRWWSPCFMVLGVCGPGAPDAGVGEPVTLTADAYAADGIDRVEWDFDGDGTVDRETAVSVAGTIEETFTTTHIYGEAGSWQPKVRGVDADGVTGDWSWLEVDGVPVDLDVEEADPPPVVQHPKLKVSAKNRITLGPSGGKLKVTCKLTGGDASIVLRSCKATVKSGGVKLGAKTVNKQGRKAKVPVKLGKKAAMAGAQPGGIKLTVQVVAKTTGGKAIRKAVSVIALKRDGTP